MKVVIGIKKRVVFNIYILLVVMYSGYKGNYFHLHQTFGILYLVLIFYFVLLY